MSTSSPSSCPSEKRAGQSSDRRAKRHRIQAWCSRRPLRRPSVDSHPPPAEGAGPEERGTALCAALGEMPAVSAGMSAGVSERPGLVARAIHATSLRPSGFGKMKHTRLRFRGHVHGPGASFSLTLSARYGIIRQNWANDARAMHVWRRTMKSVVNLASDLALRDLPPKQKVNKLKRWRHWRQVVAILEIAGIVIVEIAAGGSVGVIAARIALEAVKALSEKRRADQSKGGRAERRYIQAWRSRRALRRPSMDSCPLAAEGEGLEEKSAGLGAELDEMPAASREIHRPSNERWREKMEPSAHLVINLAIHDPLPEKVSRLKLWRHSCARSISHAPWQRIAIVLVEAVLAARRIVEIVEFFMALFASGAC